MEIYRYGRTQTIDFTTHSVALASNFGAQTRAIRVMANSPACFKIGTGAQTATSNDPAIVPTGGEQLILVTPGQAMAAIRASGGTLTSADGRMWVTELV